MRTVGHVTCMRKQKVHTYGRGLFMGKDLGCWPLLRQKCDISEANRLCIFKWTWSETTLRACHTLSIQSYERRKDVFWQNLPHDSLVTDFSVNLMYIGPCIIVIVEEQETYLISLVIEFYLTSSVLNMFRTLIHPSSGAWDFSIVSPHWSWGGIRVAGWSLLHGYHPNPSTPKLQHTSKQEHRTSVVIQ